MLLDRALRLTFRTFSTLFLTVAALTVPLHVGYSYVYREVIAVAPLHSDIEEFPGLRQVRGVGREELSEARRAGWILAGAEVLSLVLLLRAARRIVARDEAGDVPEATDAWLHAVGLRRRHVSRSADSERPSDDEGSAGTGDLASARANDDGRPAPTGNEAAPDAAKTTVQEEGEPRSSETRIDIGARDRLFVVGAGILVSIAVGVLAHRVGSLLVEPVGDDSAWASVGVVVGVARALGAPFALVCTIVTFRGAKGLHAGTEG